MSNADINKIRSEANDTSKRYSELLVNKIEETANKKTMLLDFYNNINKIDSKLANILLI